MTSMFLKLLSVFLIVPLIELYLLIKIGGTIGALNTVLIILIAASLGAYMAKSQGFRVLHQIQEATSQGRVPGNELLHGLFVLIQYFTNWIRKSSSFITISKYFSVKCLKL